MEVKIDKENSLTKPLDKFYRYKLDLSDSKSE